MRKTNIMRGSRELEEIINFVKAKHMLAGKRVPSSQEITKKIAKRINKEDLLYEDFIQL